MLLAVRLFADLAQEGHPWRHTQGRPVEQKLELATFTVGAYVPPTWRTCRVAESVDAASPGAPNAGDYVAAHIADPE